MSYFNVDGTLMCTGCLEWYAWHGMVIMNLWYDVMGCMTLSHMA